jgi:hypothetical protein
MKRAEAGLDRIDPRAALALALVASGILLLVWLSHLTFFGDEWDPLLYRRGFSLDVLLRPHAEHILLGPTLIYKGIQATTGMESLFPYAVVSTVSFLGSVVLLFLYLRRRVARAGGGAAGAVHGHRLGGPALALRGLIHRLDGRRDRSAVGAGARG